MTDQERLRDLSHLGWLLDQAVDIADRHAETLLAAQIAQALNTLDARIGGLRPAPLAAAARPGTADDRGLAG